MQLVNLIPSHKVVYYNFPTAPERENPNLSLREWWCIGGSQNINCMLDKQRKDGIKISCRLDDDDCWLPNHLEVLNMGYSSFPESVFIYTRSRYCEHHLPILHKTEVLFGDMPYLWKNPTDLLRYNNFPPMPENIVHSSVSWDISRIPFNFFVSSPKILPGDAVLWHKINQFAEKNMLKTLYIPITTVSKFDEASSLKLTS
jgi:hypothetical protein